MNSLTTCDAADMNDTIALLTEHKIKTNVIHMAAQLQICKILTQKTGGKLFIPNSSADLYENLLKLSKPLDLNKSEQVENTMVRMGFPILQISAATVSTTKTKGYKMVSRTIPDKNGVTASEWSQSGKLSMPAM